MDSMAVGGLGAGVLQGLETVRQRRRQDESDEMRRDNHDMRQQQFGLQMEGLRMGNEQTALNLDYTKKTQPLKMRQLERQDASGERQAQAERIADLSYQAFQAFQSQDFEAVNELLAEINPDNPTPPALLPPTASGDPNKFTFRMNGQDQDMSAKEFAQMLQSRSNPAGALEALAKADEQDADWRRLNDGGLYNRRTGEVKGLELGEGGYRGGSFSTSADEKKYNLYRRIYPESEYSDAEVLDLVRRSSEKPPEDQIIDIATKLMSTGLIRQEDAVQQATEIVYGVKTKDRPGSATGLQQQAPVAGQPAPAAASQQPPLIQSEVDYEALPSGAQFINSADGKTYTKP